MKKTLSEKLLYIIATILDHNYRFSSINMIGAIDGDPRLYKHRRWLEWYLKNKRKRQKIYSALYNLKRQKVLQEKIFSNGTKGYVLTEKGNLKLYRNKFSNLKKKRLPGGQNLMVFFDIPEKKKRTRDFFRHQLRNLGFEMVQQSIWISPYNVTKELTEIVNNCGLSEYSKHLLVKNINPKT